MTDIYTISRGKIFVGKVVKMGDKGDGIVFLGRMAVFLPGSVIDGRYKFEIVSVSDRFANGKILEEYGGEGK